MKELQKRLGMAVLLVALGACGDSAKEDEDPSFDESSDEDEGRDEENPDEANTDETGASVDAGTTRNRDASVRRDASTDAASLRDSGSDASTRDAAPGPMASDDVVPEGEHCADAAKWDPAWGPVEEEVLRLTNEARAKGATCGSKGAFPPAAALTMEPHLRCSARLYSKEMVDTSNFNHDSKDGTTFVQRIVRAGYKYSLAGENIAAGQSSPAAVVAAWMKSEGHCVNIMNSTFTQIGVGYYPIASPGQMKPHWTQNFGAPPKTSGR